MPGFGFGFRAFGQRGLVGGGAPTVGGITLGSAGEAGSIYEGTVLVDGEELANASFAGPSNPYGRYFDTRFYGKGARNSDSLLKFQYDTGLNHTGHNDANRGVVPDWGNITVTSEGVKLSAKRATAGQLHLIGATTQAVNLSAMIHTAGRHVFFHKSKTVLEAYIRHSPKAGNPRGAHHDFWPSTFNLEELSGTADSDEINYEANSTTGLFNWIQTINGSVDTAGQVAAVNNLDYQDGTSHKFTFVAEGEGLTGTCKAYIDGVLKGTVNKPLNRGTLAHLLNVTNHVYDGTFIGEAYVDADWAAGEQMDVTVAWWRVWHDGNHYVPPASVTLNVDYAGTASVVLDAWPGSPPVEHVRWIRHEENALGYNRALYAPQFPTGVSYVDGTRTLTADFTAGSGKAGRAYIARAAWDETNGGSSKPQIIAINRGPNVAVSALSWTTGEVVDYDLYAVCDVGDLLPKTIEITGTIPAGLGWNAATGKITGAVTTVSSGTFSVSLTNSAGQNTVKAVNWEVTAVSSAVPVAAPTLTGSPTLLASWDFGDDSKITEVSGAVSAIAGSDGTSVTLSQATASKRPTLEARNGNQAGRFTSAAQQFLQVANGLGSPAAVTAIVILEPATTSTLSILDIGKRTAAVSTSRHHMIASTSSPGLAWRKCSDTGATSNAFPNSAHALALSLIIGQSSNGTNGARSWRNGAASGVTGSTNAANPTGLTHTTLGADAASSAENRHADMYVHRVLIYAADFDATQREEAAVWAAANYGTPNNA